MAATDPAAPGSPTPWPNTTRHHNSAVIACRIPAEILGQIFTLCVADPESTPMSPPLSIPAPKNVQRRWREFRLGHVCGWWRDVALMTDTLWHNIDLSLGEKWMEVSAARARRPLVLRWQAAGPARLSSVQMDLVCHLLPRCRTVCLRDVQVPQHEHAQVQENRRIDQGPTSLPLLEELTLTVDGSQFPALHSDVLYGPTPHLRRLTLHNIQTLDWQPASMTLGNITLFSFETARMGLTSMLGWLRGMSSVEILDIRTRKVDRVDGSASPLTLPHLTLLKLKAELQYVSRLIESFSFPSTTALHLQMFCVENHASNGVADIANVFRVLSQHFADRAAPFAQLHILGDYDHVHFTGWRCEAQPLHADRSLVGMHYNTAQPDLQLDFNYIDLYDTDYYFIVDDVIHKLASAIVPSAIRSLQLDVQMHWPGGHLDRLFDAVCNVRTLYVTAAILNEVCMSLSASAHSLDADSTGQPMRCPHLESFTVVAGSIGKADVHQDYALALALADCLNTRRIAGLAIERVKLELDVTHVDKSMGVNLKRMLPDVTITATGEVL
ncbi:hypothetical protein FA95DRAFT_1558405 [Auriscalpium vulgare]|uniref:Uncharacterized protein n=1 Tax=Auriscalpium vulgare TaxID=40419 RepID=A0ACB8RUW3_9AGAM|nr:hypothetical protein FA95DRAFT_1558405 [Auriscalpium vulgare]